MSNTYDPQFIKDNYDSTFQDDDIRIFETTYRRTIEIQKLAKKLSFLIECYGHQWNYAISDSQSKLNNATRNADSLLKNENLRLKTRISKLEAENKKLSDAIEVFQSSIKDVQL